MTRPPPSTYMISELKEEVDKLKNPTFKDWKENNLCGVCPYRKEVQDRNAQLMIEVRELRKALELLYPPKNEKGPHEGGP